MGWTVKKKETDSSQGVQQHDNFRVVSSTIVQYPLLEKEKEMDEEVIFILSDMYSPVARL